MSMIYNDNGNILVQDRGGHLELKESIVDSVIREVKEETNLTLVI